MVTPHTMLRISNRALLVALLIGAACAILAVRMALEHNPQNVFLGPEGIIWSYLSPLPVIAFVLGSGGALTIYVVLKYISALLRSFR